MKNIHFIIALFTIGFLISACKEIPLSENIESCKCVIPEPAYSSQILTMSITDNDTSRQVARERLKIWFVNPSNENKKDTIRDLVVSPAAYTSRELTLFQFYTGNETTYFIELDGIQKATMTFDAIPDKNGFVTKSNMKINGKSVTSINGIFPIRLE